MTTDELDKLEQAIQTQDGIAAFIAAFAAYPRLIAIARAALALEDDGSLEGLFVWYDDMSRIPYHCCGCSAKHESAQNFVHDDKCPYAAFVKAVKG